MNNYDLVLNFETVDGKPLSEETVENILFHTDFMARTIEHFNNVKIKRAIISQAIAVSSK